MLGCIAIPLWLVEWTLSRRPLPGPPVPPCVLAGRTGVAEALLRRLAVHVVPATGASQRRPLPRRLSARCTWCTASMHREDFGTLAKSSCSTEQQTSPSNATHGMDYDTIASLYYSTCMLLKRILSMRGIQFILGRVLI